MLTLRTSSQTLQEAGVLQISRNFLSNVLMSLRLPIDANYFYQPEPSASAVTSHEKLLELERSGGLFKFSLESIVQELVDHFSRGAVE